MNESTTTNEIPTDQATSVSSSRGGYLNIAAYKFVALNALEKMRGEWKSRCLELGLRGTILLSPEGVNMFLSGPPGQVETFVNWVRSQTQFRDLEVKNSYSDTVPFRRMLVRLKQEIIPCGMETIDPGQETSPKLSARELKRWFDEGKSFRLLDVRNKYEVALGTFTGAEHLELDHFREFPQAIEGMPEESRDDPVVMFCTGGIRCEKAGPVMEQAGYKEIYQLDGGILKYFEECGGAHYDGDCFVFDGRVALDPDLNPTGHMLCFNCQEVVTADDVTSGQFRFGEYCPNCYQPEDQVRADRLKQRQTQILDYARTQPGSTPYESVREIHVPGRFAGQSMIEFLCSWQPSIAREQWESWLSQGHIVSQAGEVAQGDTRVREGEAFVQRMPNTVEPNVNPEIELLHEDDSLIVVNKPAPLPVHPSGRFNRNTLLQLVNSAYPHEKLRVAHRLDAETSGITILCRKYRAAQLVQPQFAEQLVVKKYLALVHGAPDWERKTCTVPIGQAAKETRVVNDEEVVRFNDSIARQKYWQADPEGKAAETEFRVVERFAETTLIEAIPRTGRTHQIRVHLLELNLPIVGDPLYNSQTNSQTSEDEPMCLHAQELTLRHPDSDELITFSAPKPAWMNDSLRSSS